jgi:TldD protein
MDWKPYFSALIYGDYAEIYAEESQGLGLSFEDGKVDEIESGESGGMALRYTQGEETRFGHADGWNENLVLKLSASLSGGLRKRPPVRTDGPAPLSRHGILRDSSEISLDEKVKILVSADQAIRSLKDSRLIRQVILSYGERRKRISFVSAEDLSGSQSFSEERVYTVFAATVVAGENGLLQTATEVAGALCGFELFDKKNPGSL